MARTPSLRVGLTGGIGSGKSTVAALFAQLGATVIDTDAIARQITQPGGAAVASIRETFGADLIAPSGGMDRERMRALAFADLPTRRSRLDRLEDAARVPHPVRAGRLRSHLLDPAAPRLRPRGRAEGVYLVGGFGEMPLVTGVRASYPGRVGVVSLVHRLTRRFERFNNSFGDKVNVGWGLPELAKGRHTIVIEARERLSQPRIPFAIDLEQP